MNNDKTIKKIISETITKTIREALSDQEKATRAAFNKKSPIEKIGFENFGAEVRKTFQNTIPDNIPNDEVYQYIKDNPESVKVSLDGITHILQDKISLQKIFQSKKFNNTLNKVAGPPTEEDIEDQFKSSDDAETSNKSKEEPEKKKYQHLGVTADKMAQDYDFVKSLGLRDPSNFSSNRSMIGQIITAATEKYQKRLQNIRGMEDEVDDETASGQKNPALAKFYEDFEYTADKAAEFFVKLMDSAAGDTEKFLGALKRAQLVGSYTAEEELEILDQLVELVHGDSDMTSTAPEASMDVEQLLKDDLLSNKPSIQSFRNLFAALFEQVLTNKPEEELDKILSSINVDDSVKAVAMAVAGKRRGRPPLPPEERARREQERKEARKR